MESDNELNQNQVSSTGNSTPPTQAVGSNQTLDPQSTSTQENNTSDNFEEIQTVKGKSTTSLRRIVFITVIAAILILILVIGGGFLFYY